MMPVLQGDAAKQWLRQARVAAHDQRIESLVKELLDEVRHGGDQALADIAARFNDPAPRRLDARGKQAQDECASLSDATRQTIQFAASRISHFAYAAMAQIQPVVVAQSEYCAGLTFAPVERAACYVPAGRYPLPSTALMTAITARAAGVKEVAIFTPALRPEIVFAGITAGADEFFEIGGAQAIAAAAYGTQSIKPVNVIVGPGNAYVVEAKRQLNGTVGIDMLAGPSEIAVIADGGGKPHWIALDLLSQAEHDPDARAYLLTDDAQLAAEVTRILPATIERLNLPGAVGEALSKSAILVLPTLADCARAADEIAPEHLLLHVCDPDRIVRDVHHFGALFIGYNATVAYGDYCAGPNHTLPTARAAKFAGGLNPLTFLRAQSWLRIDKPACQLARMTAAFADIEGLKAHSAAAAARIEALAQ